MRQARPGADRRFFLQRVVGWRVHLAATLIATLAVTGCSGSQESEELSVLLDDRPGGAWSAGRCAAWAVPNWSRSC